MKRLILWSVVLVLAAEPFVGAQPDEEKKAALARVLRKAEDEYRLYFKRPTKPLEFWAAITFEIEVGKYDVAALHLDQMLKLEPPEDTDRELLKVEEARGMNEFLRLQTVPKWNDNAELQKEAEQNVVNLINRVSRALERRLSDPDRINKFIQLLQAPTPEERNYAFAQLNRSRERAAPFFVEALRKNAGKPEFQRLRDTLLKLHADILPPLLEVLKAANDADAQEFEVRGTLLDIFRLRREESCVPYLWHIAGSPRYHPLIRGKARQTLASFLNLHEDKLPDPPAELTSLAERFYQHRYPFSQPDRIRVWPWNGQELARAPVVLPPAVAEQFFGTRYAKEALDLDPSYRPAQRVLLALTLDRAFAPALDQVQLKPLPPTVHSLLATLDADLLMAALERAYAEHNPAIILPLVRILGERGESRALRSADTAPFHGLTRALYYPDVRVQWAGVRALLLQPPSTTPVAGERVVELLIRFLNTTTTSKALVVGVPELQKAMIRKAVEAAGVQPVLVDRFKDGFDLLHQSADIDLILLYDGVPAADGAHLFSQLRADRDGGLLPLLVLAPERKREYLGKLARSYRNIFLDSIGLLDPKMTSEFKGRIEEVIKLSQQPDSFFRVPAATRAWLDKNLKETGGHKLSAGERKQLHAEAMYSLWRMARGELPGYDLRPAKEALFQATRGEETAVAAIETLGRLPGVDVQQRLAGIALDPARGKLRTTALMEVNRHVQKHGLLLAPPQIEQIKKIAKEGKEDPVYLGQVALLLGQIAGNPRLSGLQLRDFRLEPPAPPPEKKDEK